jgi:hypothetical protein
MFVRCVCGAGRADELVPPLMMNALYDVTRTVDAERYKRHRFVTFPTGRHDTHECPNYYKVCC